MSDAPYTLTRSEAAEARIARDTAGITRDVAASLGPRLRALWLVGSYARGEGSVVSREGELYPYNDYDFVAVVANVTRKVRACLARLGREWSSRVRADVDLWPLADRHVGHVPRTLFWLDIALGGARVLYGAKDSLQRLPRFTVRHVPLEECGRLLANRATGIALSNIESADRDLRRARHVHKAVLACGDARLLAVDRYASSTRERLEELERLRGAPSTPPALLDAYQEAVAFRARPDRWRPARGSLDEWYHEAVLRIQRWHLEFEQWRIAAPATPFAFAWWSGRVYPRLPDCSTFAPTVAAVRAFLEGSAPLTPWLGHPRERLARVAVALAYGRGEPGCRARAAELLGTAGASDDEQLRIRLHRLIPRGA